MLTKCEAFSGVIVGSRDRPYTLVAASCARAGSSSAAVHAPASAAATARPQQTLAAPPITQWTRPRRIFKKMRRRLSSGFVSKFFLPETRRGGLTTVPGVSGIHFCRHSFFYEHSQFC